MEYTKEMAESIYDSKGLKIPPLSKQYHEWIRRLLGKRMIIRLELAAKWPFSLILSNRLIDMGDIDDDSKHPEDSLKRYLMNGDLDEEIVIKVCDEWDAYVSKENEYSTTFTVEVPLSEIGRFI